jgi:hypothetical protein
VVILGPVESSNALDGKYMLIGMKRLMIDGYSTTYCADPQHSFSAVTGPVEIHAFSRWNWQQTFCRCTFTHSNVCEMLIHANRQERFFQTSARRRIAPEDQIYIIISSLFADIHTSKWHKKY